MDQKKRFFMKSLFKTLGIIAIAAVIGFSMTACPTDPPPPPATETAPAAPTGVTATAVSPNAVFLNWNAVSGATQYTVYGSLTYSGAFSSQGTVTTPGAMHYNINQNPGTTIYYKITASNSAGEGTASVIVNTTLLNNNTYSLEGIWQSNGVFVTINGSSGNITQISTTDPLTQSAINKGYISVGTQMFKNLTPPTSGISSGQVLWITYNTSAPNVAIGTQWANCNITMSADSRTFTCVDSLGSSTWTRK
jgi:hypothetical protein